MVMPVRAPGIVELDTRKVSVISLRADAFVEQVEDVTVGTVVTAGAPLAMLYSPEIAAAAALYVSDLAQWRSACQGQPTKIGQPRSATRR